MPSPLLNTSLEAQSLNSRPASTSFNPPFWLRNTHVQTIGSSLFARSPTLSAGRRIELVTSENVCLEAFLHGESNPGRQVILIHGWLGSADSSYVLTTAVDLLGAGFRVARLNLRDHGDTAHLNEDMFHSARTKEVVEACEQLNAIATARTGSTPGALIGFSLGGNFALRVCAHTSLPALAICPAINPETSCTAIDNGPAVYRRYFLRKWYRALAAKSAAFPQRYDFSNVQNRSNVLELTNLFIGNHLPYASSTEYFNAYRIWPDSLQGKPAKIIAAKDDPVIPWQSVAELDGAVEVLLTERGGHCGYVPKHWMTQQMLEFLGAPS